MKKLKIAVLISIFASVVAGVVGLSAYAMYVAAMDGQKSRLQDSVAIQARLIEAQALIATVTHNNEGAHSVLFKDYFLEIEKAYSRVLKQDFGSEFVIGKHEGDKIVFLMSSKFTDSGVPESVNFQGTTLAEPMRLALLGNTGTIVAKDYHGATVMAAYAPIPH